MKKVLALVMSLLLIFTLAACGGKAPTTNITDSVELLTTVWNSYTVEGKNFFMGGDFENMVEGAPGAYGISDAEAVDATLGFPAASIAKIDGAASIVHMNGNTFTAAAYHVIDAAELQSLVTEIKDNIMNRQWMCGFPDKLVIITVDDLYIVSAFGSAELVDNFASNVAAAYPQAKTVVDEAIIV